MAKIPTFPDLIEDQFFINMAQFKEYGVLIPYTKSSGIYNHVENGALRGSLDFFLSIGMNSYSTFSGLFRGKPFEKTIEIKVCESNLSKKIPTKEPKAIYFFICPVTRKRCRKLYVIGGKFGSAKAFDSLYYRQQTYSKNQVCYEALFGAIEKLKKLQEEKYSFAYRWHYNGKHTRIYKRKEKEMMRLDDQIVQMMELTSASLVKEFEVIEKAAGFNTIERIWKKE